ncbi:MAG: YXWGXW repeat-containing protein [Solimonas sp.]
MSLRHPLIALLLSLSLLAPFAARAGTSVFISVNAAPPPLPDYEQPWCPGPGYVWVPGYWSWNGYDYYWVPGAWVLAPVGMLWTPGYWAWEDNFYVWHPGYWGPRVGYYGGINYGYGYGGYGYDGGYWRGRTFYYNRRVSRVDVARVTHVYERDVRVDNVTVNHVSYNGGEGGTRGRPNHDDETYARQRHAGPTDDQRRREEEARNDRNMAVSVNKGRPPQRDEGNRGNGDAQRQQAAQHQQEQQRQQAQRKEEQRRQQAQQRAQLQERQQAEARERQAQQQAREQQTRAEAAQRQQQRQEEQAQRARNAAQQRQQQQQHRRERSPTAATSTERSG